MESRAILEPFSFLSHSFFYSFLFLFFFFSLSLTPPPFPEQRFHWLPGPCCHVVPFFLPSLSVYSCVVVSWMWCCGLRWGRQDWLLLRDFHLLFFAPHPPYDGCLMLRLRCIRRPSLFFFLYLSVFPPTLRGVSRFGRANYIEVPLTCSLCCPTCLPSLVLLPAITREGFWGISFLLFDFSSFAAAAILRECLLLSIPFIGGFLDLPMLGPYFYLYGAAKHRVSHCSAVLFSGGWITPAFSCSWVHSFPYQLLRVFVLMDLWIERQWCQGRPVTCPTSFSWDMAKRGPKQWWKDDFCFHLDWTPTFSEWAYIPFCQLTESKARESEKEISQASLGSCFGPIPFAALFTAMMPSQW